MKMNNNKTKTMVRNDLHAQIPIGGNEKKCIEQGKTILMDWVKSKKEIYELDIESVSFKIYTNPVFDEEGNLSDRFAAITIMVIVYSSLSEEELEAILEENPDEH